MGCLPSWNALSLCLWGCHLLQGCLTLLCLLKGLLSASICPVNDGVLRVLWPALSLPFPQLSPGGLMLSQDT